MKAIPHPASLWRGAVTALGHAFARRDAAASAIHTRVPRQRIALLGNFGTANTGNESTLAAMIQTLRRIAPRAQLACVCYAPKQVEKDHRLPAVPLNPQGPRNLVFRVLNRAMLMLPVEGVRIARMLAFLRHIDVLIVPGTGSLDDFGVPPFDWPFHLFKWCVAAKLMGIKVGFASTGAGPIAHPISRWFLKTAAASASYRSFRDENSRAFLQGIGLDTSRDAIYPDLVFSLRPEVPRTAPAGAVRSVGVGIMAYRGWQPTADSSRDLYEGYLARMADFICRLHAKGWKVRVFGGDAVDDVALADLTKLVKARSSGSVAGWFTSTPTRTSAQLLAEIAQTDRVVASRFHNVLWSLMLGKPVVSIGYAAKNKLLMDELGLGRYCHHIETFDVDDLVRDFEHIGAHEAELVQGLAQHVQKRELALREQEAIIATRLLGRE